MWTVLLGSVALGLALFVAYGVGRAMPVIVTSVLTAHDGRRFDRLRPVLEHSKAVVDLASALLLAASAGWMLGLVLASAAT